MYVPRMAHQHTAFQPDSKFSPQSLLDAMRMVENNKARKRQLDMQEEALNWEIENMKDAKKRSKAEIATVKEIERRTGYDKSVKDWEHAQDQYANVSQDQKPWWAVWRDEDYYRDLYAKENPMPEFSPTSMAEQYETIGVLPSFPFLRTMYNMDQQSIPPRSIGEIMYDIAPQPMDQGELWLQRPTLLELTQ